MFTIGKHVFVECWATYKHTSLTLIDWGEILALKLWSQNLTPVKILKTCLPIVLPMRFLENLSRRLPKPRQTFAWPIVKRNNGAATRDCNVASSRSFFAQREGQ